MSRSLTISPNSKIRRCILGDGFITKKNVSDKTETSKQELLDEFKNCNKDDER